MDRLLVLQSSQIGASDVTALPSKFTSYWEKGKGGKGNENKEFFSTCYALPETLD
jgi:hypothetical protein